MTDFSVRPSHGNQSSDVLCCAVSAPQVADIPVAITLEPAESQSHIEGGYPAIESTLSSNEAND